MKWEDGRQGTGYKKLRIWQGKCSDCYLIYYPPNTEIPEHVDPVPGKEHFRINVLLYGQDNFCGKTLFSNKYIKFFRPDIFPHSVKKVFDKRFILSFGWAL